MKTFIPGCVAWNREWVIRSRAISAVIVTIGYSAVAIDTLTDTFSTAFDVQSSPRSSY